MDDPSQARYYREAESRPDRSGRICVWDDLIREVAAAHDLDWLMVAALIFEESRFDPTLVSSAGAVGLMQVMPRYADKDSLPAPRSAHQRRVRRQAPDRDPALVRFPRRRGLWPFTSPPTTPVRAT